MVFRTRILNYSFLAISGSLRSNSVNSEVLRAVDELAPDSVDISEYQGLSLLPHFNPDHENSAPPSVREWQEQLRHAQGVIICSPEYAHGVPGVLKNALDWVVGSGEFVHKPVLIINASPSSAFIVPQLSETLTVMMGNVLSTTLPLAGKKRDELSMRLDHDVSTAITDALAALIAWVDANTSADVSTNASVDASEIATATARSNVLLSPPTTTA